MSEDHDHDEGTPDFESAGVHELNLADLPADLGILPLRGTILFPQSRIVAMSFCEPRSCIGRLSS